MVDVQKTSIQNSTKGGLKRILKTSALSGLRKLYGLRSELSRRPYRYVFILGHQRTGSSMLTQIICSHPQVAGFGESRTRYRSRADLQSLRGEVFRLHGNFWNLKSCVLDKVLFDELLPDVDTIDDEDIRWVFLLRDPIRTMRSMMEMFGNESNQLQYYCDRVGWLRHASEQLANRGRSFFTTYDRLIENADSELEALTDFLGLDPPLAKEYELQPRAGKEGVGDASSRITSGRIIAQQREHPYRPSKRISETLLTEYEQALNALSSCCECTDATRKFADSFSCDSQLSVQHPTTV